jgi:hypothetical protein
VELDSSFGWMGQRLTLHSGEKVIPNIMVQGKRHAFSWVMIMENFATGHVPAQLSPSAKFLKNSFNVFENFFNLHSKNDGERLTL